MHPNAREPELPIPADLDEQTWQALDAIAEARRQLMNLRTGYIALSRATGSLRTDTLGAPITPIEAANGSLMWLASADNNLARGAESLRHATTYTSRLSLTDAAIEQREQQSAPPTPIRPAIERTR